MACTRMAVCYVVQLPDGWGLDLGSTSDSEHVRGLFGTAVLPLPLTPRVSREEAVRFAEGTEYGRKHGVR